MSRIWQVLAINTNYLIQVIIISHQFAKNLRKNKSNCELTPNFTIKNIVKGGVISTWIYLFHFAILTKIGSFFPFLISCFLPYALPFYFSSHLYWVLSIPVCSAWPQQDRGSFSLLKLNAIPALFSLYPETPRYNFYNSVTFDIIVALNSFFSTITVPDSGVLEHITESPTSFDLCQKLSK